MKLYFKTIGEGNLTLCTEICAKKNPIRIGSQMCSTCEYYKSKGIDKKGQWIICSKLDNKNLKYIV